MKLKKIIPFLSSISADNKYQVKLKSFIQSFIDIGPKNITIIDITIASTKPNSMIQQAKAEVRQAFSEALNISLINSENLHPLNDAAEQNKLPFLKSIFTKKKETHTDAVLICRYYPVDKQIIFDIQLVDLETAEIIKSFVWPQFSTPVIEIYTALNNKIKNAESSPMHILVNIPENLSPNKFPKERLDFLKSEIITSILQNKNLKKNAKIKFHIIADESLRQDLFDETKIQKDIICKCAIKNLLKKRIRYTHYININIISAWKMSLELYKLEVQENSFSKIVDYNFDKISIHIPKKKKKK